MNVQLPSISYSNKYEDFFLKKNIEEQKISKLSKILICKSLTERYLKWCNRQQYTIILTRKISKRFQMNYFE
jgi:hypothetical protein